MPVCKENDNLSNNNTSDFNSIIDQPVHKVIRVPNNNTNIKSVKERKTDTFLDIRKKLVMRLGRRIEKKNYCMNHLPRIYLLSLRVFSVI